MNGEDEIFEAIRNERYEDEVAKPRSRGFGMSFNTDMNRYLKNLTERAKKKGQPTYHQELALELATEFNDMAHKGMYFKFTKEYSTTRIIEARNNVRRAKNPRNKGALFTALLHKSVKQTNQQ